MQSPLNTHFFARLITALPATIQLGCVIDTTQRGESAADDASPARDSGPARDSSPASDDARTPDLGMVVDASAFPDAQLEVPDAAPIDPLPLDPEDCAAICTFRAEGLPGWGSCPLESFRTPGISYDCVQTCERAQAWASPFREAASACATQEPLCFESLEGCAIRNSESDAQVAVWISIGGIGEQPGRVAGLSGDGIESTRTLTDSGGNATFEVSVDVQRVSGLGLYFWLDDDSDGRCDLSHDRFALVWSPGFEQVGGKPEEHPLATFRTELQYSGQRDFWIEDAAQRLPTACDGHPR